jgi:enoyl-CoA hydratase
MMQTPTFKTIKYDILGEAAWITFNRPEVRNALNRQMWYDIMEALKLADMNENVRAAVLTGEGKAFSAGLDIKEMSTTGFKNLGEFLAPLLDSVETINHFSKPLIAAVNGYAYGAGFEITLLCDLVVAAESAKFAFIENRRGLLSGIAVIKLPDLIGQRLAMELMLTGKTVTAQECYRIGLVNKVVPDAELKTATQELVDEIRKTAPLSNRLTKKLVAQKARNIGDLWEAFNILFHSEDVIEGFTAYLEKREPVWKGR